MSKSLFPYIHGFSKDEQLRLRNQARFAEFEIYKEIDFSKQKNVIEVGCGVGAQTEILLRRFPDLVLTSIDSSPHQLESAKKFFTKNKLYSNRVSFHQTDASQMKFKGNTFDGAFLCWILEHVPNPMQILKETKRVLKGGSKIYITEVLNSSFFLEPYSPNTWKYWMIFNDYQFESAGDPFVGAKLGNFLYDLDFKNIKTEIKTWHFDKRHPEKRKETIYYWTDLLLSAKDHLLDKKLVTKDIVKNMQKELIQIAKNPDAVFFYSFVQASANA